MSYQAQEGRLQELHVTFHGLGTPPPHATEDEKPYWLDPALFAEIVRMAGIYETEGRRIIFSFDDGNISDSLVALPILTEHNRRARFFVPTSVIDTQDHVGSNDIVTLHEAGMTLGSHGVRHTRWTMLSDRDIEVEILQSRETLSSLTGDAVTSVAIPFGAYDRRVVSVLANLDLATVFTSDGGLAYAGDWVKARTTIRSTTPITHIKQLFSVGDTILQKLRYRVRRQRYEVSLGGRPRRTGVAVTSESA